MRARASVTAPAFITCPSMMVCGGSGGEAPPDDLQLLARLLELHDLDGARADVDADEVLAFGHEIPLWASRAADGALEQSSRQSVAPRGERRQKPRTLWERAAPELEASWMVALPAQCPPPGPAPGRFFFIKKSAGTMIAVKVAKIHNASMYERVNASPRTWL